MKRIGSLLSSDCSYCRVYGDAANTGTGRRPGGGRAARQPRRKLMRGIPFPASNIIFDAQSTDPGAKRRRRRTPRRRHRSSTRASTAAGRRSRTRRWRSQETANLITIPGRMCENGKPVPLDQDDFKKWAANLAAAGEAAFKAAQSKNLDAMVDVAGTVSDACAMCHEKYRETPGTRAAAGPLLPGRLRERRQCSQNSSRRCAASRSTST